ncbi:hypothetical protein K7432_014886 [Basidiobolus ranarum]|uniref:SUI1 domain-containing protein n=1 Tax=Basidiobolus ranarum TaxID=34480 RepID=A0ABR2WGW9_9FUNG
MLDYFFAGNVEIDRGKTGTVIYCNGTIVEDEELGEVIQLQGDQRIKVATFLVQQGITKKELIKIHGF